jgi:DNA-binding MurR/RpiR family transcriptional regulator
MTPQIQEFVDNDDSYISRIRSKYDAFSKSQKQIARYLTEHPEVILTHSITSLSRKIGTTPPSMTRFCQMIHYKGFSDLKFCIEKQISSPFSEDMDVRMNDGIDDIRKKLIAMNTKAIADTLLLMDEAAIRRAVKIILAADNVFIYADGANGSSASYAYHALLQLGIPSNLFSDYCLGKMAAVKLKKNDVAIGLTFSGNSLTVLDVMGKAADQGAGTIGITAHTNSGLAKLVTIPLCYSLHIGDDLRYLHIARMCEIAIIGLIQSALINAAPPHVHDNLARSRKVTESFRQR